MKNNFKSNTTYQLVWFAIKDSNDPSIVNDIIVKFTKNDPWPYGEEVTDIRQILLTCSLHNFRFNDLYQVEDGNYHIKKGSKEWDKYMKDQGKPMGQALHDSYLKRFGKIKHEGDVSHILANLEKEMSFNIQSLEKQGFKYFGQAKNGAVVLGAPDWLK